jgi:DNA-binding MarR family transcriptional regulator
MPAGSGKAASKPCEAGGPGAAAGGEVDLQLWLRMLACVDLVEGELRRLMREHFGTTLARFDALAQLDRFPDGLTMSELSRHLMVSHGNVTGLIDRLADERLVERRTDQRDRRIQRVTLTSEGKTLFDTMVPLHRQWLAALLQDVPSQTRADLAELLGQMKRSVRARIAGR